VLWLWIIWVKKIMNIKKFKRNFMCELITPKLWNNVLRKTFLRFFKYSTKYKSWMKSEAVKYVFHKPKYLLKIKEKHKVTWKKIGGYVLTTKRVIFFQNPSSFWNMRKNYYYKFSSKIDNKQCLKHESWLSRFTLRAFWKGKRKLCSQGRADSIQIFLTKL